MDESVDIILKRQPASVQKKVKEYLKFEKKDADTWRVERMIEKAREELHL